ncbi:MAG: OmpA family protein [Armatimonadetes bacterium]|nr:OmpA family protein [Armatimonadota bacterium]
MRIKPLGKVLIFLIVLTGLGFGAYRYMNGGSKEGGLFGGGGNTVSGDQGILGRPLRVGIVTWPGYAGGLVANHGFKPNKECIYWKNHKLLVEFMLMEDVDARAKAFAKGGPDGVDIVWSTVDFWGNELPGFIKGGVDSKAIMQVDWSRGGDAIVVRSGINRIEDLAGKKISLALFTPSHWLLEYSLANSSLDDTEQARIVKALVGKNASPDARADFVAGKVDAAVVWEPDVTECLNKRPGSKILVSSKTAANLIADLMVARTEFIKQHPDVIKAFVKGWLEGTTEANRRPDLAVNALMENEPLYKDLGQEETLSQLSTVKWADLVDNTKMFGLDGSEPLFDRIFKEASTAWVRRGYIPEAVRPSVAKDDSFLKEIYAEASKNAEIKAPVEESKFPARTPKEKVNEPALMTKPVNIFFATGQASLDPNAKQALDQVALTAQTYSNAYIRVEGNTDSRGSAATNTALSQRRAQSVVNYLVSKYHFNAARFIAKGNGPNKPVASNDTEEGRSKNRRTDIMVVPK